MQCQVKVQGDFAGGDRYTISDIKTKKMTHNQCKKVEPIFSMNGKLIENADSYTHLGLIRNSKLNDNAELITVYSLMGAGLCD